MVSDKLQDYFEKLYGDPVDWSKQIEAYGIDTVVATILNLDTETLHIMEDSLYKHFMNEHISEDVLKPLKPLLEDTGSRWYA